MSLARMIYKPLLLAFYGLILLSPSSYGGNIAGEANLDRTCIEQMAGEIQVNCRTRINIVNIASGTVNSFSVIGTTQANNAAVGQLGEYKSASNSGSPTAFPSSSVYGDAGNVSLTPGDWDISYLVSGERNTATWSRIDIAISSTAGDNTTGFVLGDNFTLNIWANSSSTPEYYALSIPAYRVSIAATTTYYGKVRSTYTAGQPNYYFRLSARRVR